MTGRRCSAERAAAPARGQGRIQTFPMGLRKRPRLDLKPIIPVSPAQAFQQIAPARQSPRLPLFEYVAVLVEHERRVAEETGGAASQVNATPAGRRVIAGVKARNQRVLDHLYAFYALPEHSLERRMYSGGDGDFASE